MILAKVISTSLDNAGKRLIKMLGFGKSDFRTPIEASPFGTDSNPIKDIVAVYADTSIKGDMVIVGYLNKNQKAEPGEHRTYATDTDGNEIFYIWMKKNGTVEINGNSYHLTRYEKIDESLQNWKTKLELELGKISTAIAGLGGSYAPGDISIDTSQAKAEKIKCE